MLTVLRYLGALLLPYMKMLAPMLGMPGNYGNMGLFGVCGVGQSGTFCVLGLRQQTASFYWPSTSVKFHARVERRKTLVSHPAFLVITSITGLGCMW